MGKGTPRLELRGVLEATAAEIEGARARVKVIHRSKDIRAAGNELEVKVREVIRRWLPATASAGHGHIVDSKWEASPQLDVIVADRGDGASLFRTEDGTEYFPYESVYGFGEVKTSFESSRKQVEGFSATIRSIRTGLFRKPTPPDWFPGISFGSALDVSNSFPYKNPLFRGGPDPLPRTRGARARGSFGRRSL